MQQHAKVVRVTVEVSVGAEDADRTIDSFIDDIKTALGQGTPVDAHNLTVMGSYYILDGKVCMPADYDPQTRARKPGTYPPVWAGGPSEQDKARPTYIAAEPDDDRPREFVRVKPTQARRDPITGLKPRKPRSDKGMKKGPRVPAQKAS